MKALQILTAAVLVAALASGASAHQDKSTKPHRKYDFTLIRKENGQANWGSWDQAQIEKFKAMGPGLYVKKDGATYVITDPDTLRKTEDALQVFKDVSKKFKADGQLAKEQARTQEMSKWAKEHGELARKLGEEARAYAEKMRDNKDPEAQAKFREKMRQLQEQMKELSKTRKEAWRQGEFGKHMAEFGRQMRLAADQAGDKIEGIIDQAFAKGLARRL